MKFSKIKPRSYFLLFDEASKQGEGGLFFKAKTGNAYRMREGGDEELVPCDESSPIESDAEVILVNVVSARNSAQASLPLEQSEKQSPRGAPFEPG